MKYRALIAAFLISGCQTITVQGVEITREDQFWASVFLVAGAVVVAELADDQDDNVNKPDCKTIASPPDDKGGETFCAIPLD